MMEDIKTEVVETDILILGGGMSGCGAAVEASYWAKAAGLKVTIVDKAAIDRSGAVAMGLSAINTYMGLDGKVNKDSHTPDEFVRYVRNDQMGIIREDLVYDVARHVDSTVRLFDKWGLPIWKDEQGNYIKSGGWQVMISGESYKVIVAEAAKNAIGMENIYERITITHLLKDENDINRVCGAVGFSVRENKFYVFKAKVVYCGMGGAVHVFRPRSQGEGLGRSWYAVFNAGTTYALLLLAGAEMTQMDLRFVPPRFKDSYGPVGTFFLLFNTPATNALGENYMETRKEEIEKYAPYGKIKPYPTCLRNHAMLLDMKDGKAPILMHHEKAAERIKSEVTDPKEQKKKLREFESEAWEDFLDMTISGATNWAAHNVDPIEKPMEMTTSEPVFIGSHSGGTGAWCCGAEDLMPAEYKDTFPAQYNCMTTIMGLFTAGDGVGACGHKFSSGSFTQGRIAAKAMVKFAYENKDYVPKISEETINKLREEVYKPIKLFETHSKYTVTPEINPNYISPNMFMFRLQKIMDEYVGGWATGYVTSDTMLETALWKLQFCREDIPKIAAANLHELQRAWENIHRYWVAETHTRALLARKDTRYPGYYYKLDYPELKEELKQFYNLKYDVEKDEWQTIQRPMISIVD